MKTLHAELSQSMKDDVYDLTDSGIYFPREGVHVAGEYWHTVNGGDLQVDKNLLTTEGLAFLLNVSLGATAKPAGLYLALYSGAISPAANWVASSFASVATEITSTSEGYSEANRQTWTPAAATGASIDNFASVAAFTIVTSSSINVNGIALLTSNTRGGTTGTLVSASRYSSPRVLYNGDVHDVGYRLTLS